MQYLLLAICVLSALLAGAHAQISKARTDDSHWLSTGSKFLSRKAENDADEPRWDGWEHMSATEVELQLDDSPLHGVRCKGRKQTHSLQHIAACACL